MKDREIIARQLDRSPQGLIGVPHRCRFGYPTVITTRPLIRKEGGFELFPTLYWLSCPRRVEALSRIEAEGYINKLEEELNSKPKLKEKYENQVEDYVRQREKLLTEEDRKFIENRGLERALKKGIGGIEDIEHLKCLHLHVAHQLAGENVIGEILIDRFQLEDCPSEDVICDRFTKDKESGYD